MISLASLLSAAHLIGLALGVGAATAKLALLLRCRRDHGLVRGYLEVVRPLTRQVVLGMVLLTLSGLGWLWLGYPFTPRLGVKLVLVAAILVAGPIIDNVVEPRFRKLAPGPGKPASPAFLQAQARYLGVEVLATLLFYAIIALWVLR